MLRLALGALGGGALGSGGGGACGAGGGRGGRLAVERRPAIAAAVAGPQIEVALFDADRVARVPELGREARVDRRVPLPRHLERGRDRRENVEQVQ